MILSWNEIKDRALKFSKEWQETEREEADAKPFLVEFFNVFGISSKRVSTFEHRVKKLDQKDGYIDLLWKGNILIEMKSRGKNLDKAFTQAKEYTFGLKEFELPKYILICDFKYFRLYDLEEDKIIEFTLDELVNNVQHFGYLLGYQKKIYKEQDPANIKAAELMGKLHDRLEEIGYSGHALEVYLVRILFCMFAEDTTIFEKEQFQEFVKQRTSEDGSDLAGKLQELFQVLNTSEENRFKNLDEQLANFPYINGNLFAEILPTASFDSKMRQALLDCSRIDWSKISPAIFGSMFQSVMNPEERRNLGAHYTSETNILKLIKPLFLDELWSEFESIKGNRNKLPEFHKKLSTLKFLDPACGCGNFLIITYRELRLLEFEVLKAQNKSGQAYLDVSQILWIDVDQFYGIEYEEFPARIAEVAMWLIDHQMNMLVSAEFGQYFARLPLKKSAKIVNENALRIDWETVILKNELSYIIGNPPFYGAMWLNDDQREDIQLVLGEIKRAGVLDYVSCWYVKAAIYIQETKIKVGYVSTNSITQGEQVGILWKVLLNIYNIKIHFGHQTFRWSNEAKGNAAVHCVIIGFANFDVSTKSIFEYENIKSEPHEIKVKNINPYLLQGKDIIIETRSEPLCQVPKMTWGNQPRDGGNFVLSEEEYFDLIKESPEIQKFIKLYIGGRELINNQKRYCFWLKGFDPSEINKHKIILEKIGLVRDFRLKSIAASTRRFANSPSLFAQISQLDSAYLAIPEVSSERRKYIPIGYLEKDVIASNKLQMIPNASLFLFGILTSDMHMAWMRYTCGRMKSDYSYSNSLVYNNFPWPENPSEKQRKSIEEKAQQVLGVRLDFPDSSLADLYNPLTMPPSLTRAHNELDKAVDLAYRSQAFLTEVKRMEFLFELYEKYTADLFTKEKLKKVKIRKK